MSIRPFLAIVRKDLRVFLSDRRAVTISFVVPLVLASIFSSLGPGGGEPRAAIPVLVVDQDRTPLSREVVEGLDDDPYLKVSPAELDDARARVSKGEVGVSVVIPEGFAAGAGKAFFGASAKPELTFLTDPTHAAEAGMVRGLLTQHVMQAVARDAFSGPGGLASLDEAEKQVEGSATVPFALRQALKLMFRDIRDVRKAQGEPGEGKGAAGAATSRSRRRSRSVRS